MTKDQIEAALNNPAIKAMADAEVRQQYSYLGTKLGRYLCEVQALKLNGSASIMELKILKAEKTSDQEPHRVGSIQSQFVKLDDPKKGGGSRVKAAVFAALDLAEGDLKPMTLTFDEIVEDPKTKKKAVESRTKTYEGKAADSLWFAEFHGDKQPVAFALVEVEVKRETLPAKPPLYPNAREVSREVFSPVEMTEEQADEVDRKRAAANLPALADIFG